MAKTKLTVPLLCEEASAFAEVESTYPEGYLTISNALQWRLQYARAIDEAGKIEGILKLR